MHIDASTSMLFPVNAQASRIFLAKRHSSATGMIMSMMGAKTCHEKPGHTARAAMPIVARAYVDWRGGEEALSSGAD